MDRPPAPDGSTMVVGVDGTAASLAALRWAVGEAAAHGCVLQVVHVQDPRTRRRAAYDQAAGWDREPDARAVEIEELIERAAGPAADRVVETGAVDEVLLRHADGARMLVLGKGDHRLDPADDSRRREPALGAVARACITRAACPVVVVPAPTLPSANEVGAARRRAGWSGALRTSLLPLPAAGTAARPRKV